MKDELITFETAKLAKEKGFGWKTVKCFCSKWIFKIHNRHDDDLPIFDLEWVSKNYPEELIAKAPTQSLLQRWLREKHGLIITLSACCYISSGKPKCSGYRSVIQNMNTGVSDAYPKTFDKPNLLDTYEQALEKGLYEALKLIKQ